MNKFVVFQQIQFKSHSVSFEEKKNYTISFFITKYHSFFFFFNFILVVVVGSNYAQLNNPCFFIKAIVKNKSLLLFEYKTIPKNRKP